MCDKYSWLQGFAPRADGQPLRSNPYDSSFNAKPLHTAVRDAFTATMVRT
jgi:endo-1,4-beta-xylanase